jgi:hypothetical protein
MKKLYLFTASLCLLLISMISQAQPTTLSAGDIVIVGWNSTDNTVNSGIADDDIDFLLLKNINAGTVIYFTDFGWTGSGFQLNENNGCTPGTGAASDGCIKWTASTFLPIGTQIRIGCKVGLTSSTGTVTGVTASATPGIYVSLTTAIDQIFAFQGSLASPTFIAAVQYGGPSWLGVTSCQFTSTASANPGALVGGYSLLYTSTIDNNKYSGALLNGNAAILRTAILNQTNWTQSAVALPFPISISFLITLPVHLTAFDVKKSEAGNILQWKVENEDNFSHYEVETSTNGANYTTIGSVKASTQSSYSFTATPSQSAYQLYRLKLVDLNGKFDYSKIVRIDNGNKLKPTVFPNPAYNIITVSSGEPITSLSLADISGKKCLQQKVDKSNSITFDIASLKPGVYMLTINTTTGSQTERIYKKEN